MKEKEIIEAVKNSLGIADLNEMQKKMLESSHENRDIMLLSPTGSGKTLAFSLVVLKLLKPPTGRIQCVVIAPSRELVVQIAGVLRGAANMFRVVALYGGHKVEDEVNSLKVTPDIIVSTPGRLLDHSVRHNLELLPVRILVLDEFDKSLELGFEEEMGKLVKRMKNVSRIILTSATNTDTLPEFLNLNNPKTIDYSNLDNEVRGRMKVKKAVSDETDKLESLYSLLQYINSGKKTAERSIVFVNHRESAERVYGFLKKQGADCVLYHGALEQKDREMALAKFNNGSTPILVATDLAARGLDIENVQSVVHYHLPLTEETYKHRNGRTARVDASGEVYILVGLNEKMRDFMEVDEEIRLTPDLSSGLNSEMETIYISSGKREKISKGDIVGFLVKECGLEASEIGKIDIFDHYSLAAIYKDKADAVIKKAEGKKIKGEKRRLRVLK